MFQFILTSCSQERRLSVALEEVLTSSEEPAARVLGIAAQGVRKITPIPQMPGWYGGIRRLSGLMAALTLPSPATEPGCFPTPSPSPDPLSNLPGRKAQVGQVAGEMLRDAGGEEECAAAWYRCCIGSSFISSPL